MMDVLENLRIFFINFLLKIKVIRGIYVFDYKLNIEIVVSLVIEIYRIY